jgi:hypothetical protein
MTAAAAARVSIARTHARTHTTKEAPLPPHTQTHLQGVVLRLHESLVQNLDKNGVRVFLREGFHDARRCCGQRLVIEGFIGLIVANNRVACVFHHLACDFKHGS